MKDLIKIAVEAIGGDNSPNKIIDGIIHNNKNNKDIVKILAYLHIQKLAKFSQDTQKT